MTKADTKQAARLLDEYTDRIDVCGADTAGGWCLTAYWPDGGQRLFWTLDEVRNHIDLKGDNR